ncbi:GntR family transcriptional regulator [uncultured Anaerococcus sp.]|uniref:GntR family transcriptional regulator n=1 Tax=uncultured Anaerococcus sp. TaxID=293428 RepID=UPI00263805AC|nr:GntR family transcriptional regulator [uncultured Anaerococcus sp.]
MSLYSDIVDDLSEEIKNMKKGDRIPSERQLCAIYNVSRTTIRNAINELVNSGLIYQIHGKGSFVTGKIPDQDNLNKYYSFTQRTIANGQVPRSKVIDFRVIHPTYEISRNLKIRETDLVISFTRLRLANDVPMMYEVTYIPYYRFERVTKNLIETKPLYEIFDEKASTKIFNVNERLSVGTLSGDVAKYLQQNVKEACLKIVRKSYDFDDRVLEYTISLARGDKFYYETSYNPL